jgi:multidrug efflux pump subunit AcrA (membrane-fusion protein)
VQAQADVADAARLSVGQAAEVIVEGLDGQVLSARVDRINPAADATSRALPIYVDFVNPGRRVRAGMFAHVRLHLGAGQTRLSVPIPAVQTDAGQSIVWEVLDGHRRAP